jgi:CheY-like chemotaxis protein
MLAFGRKQMLQPRLIDLNEAISESRGLLQRLMGEDIILETVLAPGLGSVRVDPGQLSQVLLNLAANARDAMPCGGRLLVATSATELNRPPAADEEGFTPGPYVLLEVRDTGAGMDDATQARLFEPFFTTKEEGRGSGLGLSSVYGIVRQSGGWIAVESAPGAGTAFLIYFPACEGSVLVPESPHPASPSPRSHETILLVEDEPEVRAFASAVLRSEGYRVLEAGDGFSALALAEEHAGPIHLLLTDVVMPRMPGSTLAANLRQLRPDARVLFMSGYPGDVVAVRGALSGPVSFLSKPFTPEQLTGALRAALAG